MLRNRLVQERSCIQLLAWLVIRSLNFVWLPDYLSFATINLVIKEFNHYSINHIPRDSSKSTPKWKITASFSNIKGLAKMEVVYKWNNVVLQYYELKIKTIFVTIFDFELNFTFNIYLERILRIYHQYESHWTPFSKLFSWSLSG